MRVEECLLAAFPGERGASLSIPQEFKNAQFALLRDVSLDTPSSSSTILLVGQVCFSSKRQGVLLLKNDDNTSIPISLHAKLKSPELLNAIVIVTHWQCAALQNYDEDADLVHARAWLQSEEDAEEGGGKRRRVLAKSNHFYLECIALQVIGNSGSRPTRPPASLCASARVIGLSPEFKSSNGDRYWLVEFDDAQILACFGDKAKRMMLNIGSIYRIYNAVHKSLAFGNQLTLPVLIANADELEMEPYCYSSDDAEELEEKVFRVREPSVTHWNIVHYEGEITAHLSAFVLELDFKFKLFLHKLPVVQLWLGARVGALVRLHFLSQVNYCQEVIGFEATWRTEMQIIAFSSKSSAQFRLPASPARYSDIPTPALYFALDLMAKLGSKDWALFHRAVEYCKSKLPSSASKDMVASHPITRFLYDWDVALEENAEALPRLVTLHHVVTRALHACGKNALHVSSNERGQFLLCRMEASSIVPNQFCLVESESACAVECTYDALPPTRLQAITRFQVVVERFSRFPLNAAAAGGGGAKVDLAYTAPKLSKGHCLWHGHVKGTEDLALTRVYIRVLECEDWNDEDALPAPVPTSSSSFFSFDSLGQTVFTSSLPVMSANAPSIATAFTGSNNKSYAVLCFLLLSVQCVQASKFNLAFENERRKRLEELAVRPSRFFAESALKLTVRDLHSPLELDIFLPLDNRVLPPGLLHSSSLPHEQCTSFWALTNCSVTLLKSNKPYIQAQPTSAFVQCKSTDGAYSFPRDLIRLGRTEYLCSVRSSLKIWGGGACIAMQVTRVLWAKLRSACSANAPETGAAAVCPCACNTSKCYRLEALVEADDGTDQAQVFAETTVAPALLGLPSWERDILPICGAGVKTCKQIEFRMSAQCEANSPQGLFRALILSRQAHLLQPRRAYVIRERAFHDQQDKRDYVYYSSERCEAEEEEEYGLEEDSTRFAYVRTWDDGKVKSRVRDKLTLKLLAMELEPSFDDLRCTSTKNDTVFPGIRLQ